MIDRRSENKTKRLYFIDAMRAWAILMMLQGHFIDGLLDPVFRNASDPLFAVWAYNRGITAPVFFTVAGFIFVYLLIRNRQQSGWANPRAKRGLRRGLMLLALGYVLRLDFKGFLLRGEVYDNFYMLDVLHCIGLSLLFLTGLYLLTCHRGRHVMPVAFGLSTLVLFALAPLYTAADYSFFPKMLANYFTKAHGSVFTVFPWFGFASFGGLMATLFHRFGDRKALYPAAISLCLSAGILLILICSLPDFHNGWFSRLGNVLVFFAVFMLARKIFTPGIFLTIGQNTLSIYMIHYILLYGSLFGLGLYQPFHHSLPPYIAIPGAIVFVLAVTWLSFRYNSLKPRLREIQAALLTKGRSWLRRRVIRN
ncbi:heparan-alpha-glucosaminide N-acetyltransferase domain-containing protein [Sinomicrobium soli]|uniref:heparan-alpha-glucosaminide N-acetyltransferase domain-containing protein n=1 Tax=Sinomicrobium sp. N-1-3-6 TaxID=2219864 RepID=UPI000DCEFE03|nr:heparan-alpha-glucosaminide N-acetyltransferase domain-containing protein [Sinomicrobium sp. N-1-3-6]RAV30176.1 hypothetical protein DN748_05110 [Sinomicrobium sp. N-1-3-6]